jgi:hypothetical protein
MTKEASGTDLHQWRQLMTAENRTWQELCEAASNEPDPEKLMALISELMRVLDERDNALQTRARRSVCRPTLVA